ncbi:MAG TPA: inositol monophosphatase family protein [Gemmatimonadales bacterium]|nr:inositol monophosphatase family protein [Gemmatimonadales bacterium]
MASSAARRAGEVIAAAARQADRPRWDKKGPRDYVTDVDRRAEDLIRSDLLAAFPDSTVLGEELTPHAPPSATGALAWIVDPLDGTANFLHGYPWYAVSIAAVERGRLAAGVVFNIPQDRLYAAAPGEGAWDGDRRLAVSDLSEPARCLIGTGFPFRTPDLVPRYLRQFCTINAQVSGIRRAGSASLDLVDIALGRFDGFWELALAPWDIAAGTLIVREAGGVVTDVDGSGEVLRHGPIVAGNPAVHRWLMDQLP